MGRTVVFEENVRKKLEDLSFNQACYVGVIIGQVTGLVLTFDIILRNNLCTGGPFVLMGNIY